ncbi:alanyl-tRNA editing protein [Spirochaetia bacterium]|nr:alanyl-tRNA editing protein [Spirochaetia bacterium]
MKTQRAYYDFPTPSGDDPFSAAILEVRPHGEGLAVILDKTPFYPEGGGQSADRGTINGVPLLDVQEEDGEILHFTASGAALSPGPAELVLDRRRRRDFTVHHTAQHLLSGTLLRLTGFPTVSMHLGEELCTIDVTTPEIPRETLIEVEAAAADAIEGDHPIIIHLCPPERVEDFPLRKAPPQGEGVIRVVEIRGNDFSPCCGTHVRRTGEIGALRILGAEKYKGMTRIAFIAGRRVLRDSRSLRENGDTISRALKVPVGEIGKAVLALLEKTDRLEGDLKAREEEGARHKAEELLRKAGLLKAGENGQGRIHAESFPDVGMEELLRIGRAAQKLTGAVLVLGSETEAKFAALCSLKGTDIRPLLQKAMEERGGRGGGGPSFFQGQFSSHGDLRAFIAGLGL